MLKDRQTKKEKQRKHISSLSECAGQDRLKNAEKSTQKFNLLLPDNDTHTYTLAHRLQTLTGEKISMWREKKHVGAKLTHLN